MRLNLFVCRDGWLLSSECMLASREAEDAHGPVSAFLGILDCAQLPDPVCRDILEGIYARQFAFLPRRVGKSLDLARLANNTPPRRHEPAA